MTWRGAALAGLLAEAERGFLWAPVLMALGVLWYFALKTEPDLVLCAGVFAVMLAAALGICVAGFGDISRIAIWCTLLISFGFSVAALRAQSVSAYVLEYRYYGPVEGRVIGLDRSASGAMRVTLDQVRLGNRPTRTTPAKVRVSLFGTDADLRPEAYSRVMTTAHLSPPNGPAEPDGFDFRRHAWFLGLGGVGYTRVPVMLVTTAAPERGAFAVRLALSDRVRHVLGGQTGAFAAALISGDRSALSLETLEHLRRTNLAHLLAISGLHMGLLAGFVFGALRLGLGAIPALSHSIWTKKLAALGALVAAFGYMSLSGGSVATERAFIMASVALGAILLDRRAISLRAVALSALIVMMLRPEAVLGPGFQMSFAATTALVITFQWLTRRVPAQTAKHWLWRAVSGTCVSSLVAGLATMPIAAAHFNHFSHYGLIANLAATPLMGIWIMPLAVLSVCLMPLGWDGPVLKGMEIGLEWILGVASEVSGWTGAVSKVPSPEPLSFFGLALGMVLLGVCATRLRVGGAVLIGLGLVSWSYVERPDVMIAADGTLVGVQTPLGRALNKETGAGFVAGIWLENDGDAADQWRAAQRWGGSGGGALRVAALDGTDAQLFAASGKTGLRAFEGCTLGDIAVFSERAPEHSAPCTVFDSAVLAQTGAVGLYLGKSGVVKTKTARESAGRRLWNTPELRESRSRLLQRVLRQ